MSRLPCIASALILVLAAHTFAAGPTSLPARAPTDEEKAIVAAVLREKAGAAPQDAAEALLAKAKDADLLPAILAVARENYEPLPRGAAERAGVQLVFGFVAHKPLEQWIVKQMPANNNGNPPAQIAPRWVSDPAVVSLFPDTPIFAHSFRQYPVGVMPPAPFKSHNIFVVTQAGEVTHITDPAELQAFFKKQVKAADEHAIRQVLAAWLALTCEFSQDGFYKFEVQPEMSFGKPPSGGGFTLTGKAIAGGNNAPAGNTGSITVTMTFTEAGALTDVQEQRNLKPGMRPICQATKLLDPDPIVRKMAEQDLLLMGRLARPYLDEQRAKASPQLQRAIDQMWKRILEREAAPE